MMRRKNKFINNNYSYLPIFLILYLTVLLGFYFNEDSLGGAEHDFIYHLNISNLFNENFSNTWNKYGVDPVNRNSPIFWILVSFIIKFASVDLLRFLNLMVTPLIVFFFYKCLLIKFKEVNQNILGIIACTAYLSPSIRSLSIWPYSLIWGLLLFIISIYYFLKFTENIDIKQKFKLSILSSLFLILSSYLYPTFAVFYFYFIKFFVKGLNAEKIIKLLIFCFTISIPAFYYILSKDIYSAFTQSEGIASLTRGQALNLSNKIIIISTIYIYLLIPFVNFKNLFVEIKKKIKLPILIFIIIFVIINIFYFNFPYFKDGGYGGGFFHKLSYILFKNFYLLYAVFFISLIILYTLFEKNTDNFLLFIMTIIYTPQFTIYNKYYDPLIIILFFLLFKIDTKKYFFNCKNKFTQAYSLLIIYLIMGLFKSHFI